MISVFATTILRLVLVSGTLILVSCGSGQVAVSPESAQDAHPGAQAAVAAGFEDDWNRADGPLGNGWRSAHLDHRNWWDPLGIRDASPVNTDPDQGPIVQPDNSGGRTAAYRDFGSDYADNFTIGTWWNGKHQAPGYPVACINLDDPDWGLVFCFEPEIAGGAYILWALGRRPDQIRVVNGSGGPKHVDGTPMFLEMRIQGGTVICLADGKEVLRNAIPQALLGSTIHGFGLDINPVPGRPPNVEVINGPLIITPLKP